MKDALRDDLLLACLSPTHDLTLRSLLLALNEEDWGRLVDRSLRHRVAPLVLRRAIELDLDSAIPQTALDRLNVPATENERLNRRRWQRIAELVDCLHLEGIDPILLKGVHLAEVFYRSLAARFMEDVDILVPRAALPRAEQLAIGLGYGPTDRPSIVDDCNWNLHIFPFILDEGNDEYTQVEMHWTIEQPTSPFTIDVHQLRKRAEHIQIMGRSALVLGIPDLLLHLSLHAAFHHGFDVRLRHMCDIAWVLNERLGTMDWEELVMIARAAEAHRIVFTCLSVVSSLFSIPIPTTKLAMLSSNPEDERIVRIACLHVWQAAPKATEDWLATRRLLNQWLRSVTGLRRRDENPPSSMAELPMRVPVT